MKLDNRKLIIIIASLTTLLLVLAIIVLSVGNRPNSPESRDPEVVQKEVKQVIQITEIPRIEEAQGGGIDTNAKEIQRSQQSIEKIRGALPYYKSFTTSEGIEVEVSIPPVETVSNDWTLLVHIFGPDYQIPPNDPEYEVMKEAFLAGVDDTLLFLKQHNVNLSEVIIQWGDRAIIGERSQEWLRE